ncbi:MAG: hypothetical protein ACYDHW_04985 [Syntrophorhabdaceae bacterium]
MKVSKPVLILCIVILLVTGYVHFFTGKKKPGKGPVPPAAAQAQSGQQAGAVSQGQPAPAAQSAPQAQAAQGPQAQAAAKSGDAPQAVSLPKPQFDKLNLIWAGDPFALPALKKDSRKDSGSAVRLSAILDRGGNRVAIIDKDVVKKGDFIGKEKIAEIGSDRVVLIRGTIRRTLILADPDAFTVTERSPAQQKTGEPVPQRMEPPQPKPNDKPPAPERAK